MTVYQKGTRWRSWLRGTALQAGRSQVQFPVGSMKFFIDIILPAALWVPGIFPGAGAYLTTFMYQLSWNLASSTSWKSLGLSTPVMGLLLLNQFTRAVSLNAIVTMIYNAVITNSDSIQIMNLTFGLVEGIQAAGRGFVNSVLSSSSNLPTSSIFHVA
jgi:hypothetical protein